VGGAPARAAVHGRQGGADLVVGETAIVLRAVGELSDEAGLDGGGKPGGEGVFVAYIDAFYAAQDGGKVLKAKSAPQDGRVGQ